MFSFQTRSPRGLIVFFSAMTAALTCGAQSNAPVINSPSTALGTVGLPFSYQVTVSSGSPTNFSVVIPIPGFVTNQTNVSGEFIGLPQTNGVFTSTVTAVSPTGNSSTNVVIQINPPAAPTFLSPVTVFGIQNQAGFSYPLSAFPSPSNVPTRFFSPTNLPAGLGFSTNTVTNATYTNITNPTVTITGTPTTNGSFIIPIVASNAGGAVTNEVTFIINPTNRPVFTANAINIGASVGQPFSYDVTALNLPTGFRITNFVYAAFGVTNTNVVPITNGFLTNGLTFSNVTNGNIVVGRVSGVPGGQGVLTLGLSASNSFGSTTNTNATLTITTTFSQPVVVMSQPVGEVTYVNGSSFYLNAQAFDDLDDVLLPSTYQFQADGVQVPGRVGIYGESFGIEYYPDAAAPITASAQNAFGVARVSAPLPMFAAQAQNPLPEVTMLPLNFGQQLVAGGKVVLSARATIPSTRATIDRVEFYVNKVYVGSSSAPEPGTEGVYEYEWTAPSLPASFQVTARAVSLNFQTGAVPPAGLLANTPYWASVLARKPTVVNTVQGVAPSVAITSPSSNGTLNIGVPNRIQAAAFLQDGAIESVEFFANGKRIVSTGGAANPDLEAPYEVDFTPLSFGAYEIYAIVTGSNGLQTVSPTVIANVVAGSAPTSFLTTPASARAAAVLGSPSTNANGVVTFSVTNSVISFQGSGYTNTPEVRVVGGGGSGALYFSQIATNGTNAGSVTNLVRTNAGSGYLTTPAVVIDPPLVAVSSNSTVLLQATAADTDGTISQVDFLQNGVVVGTVTGSPYNFTLPITAAGRYELVARATDNLGNVTDSPAIVLSGVDGTPPTASFTINSTGVGQQMPVDNPELSVRAVGSNLVFSFMRISGATYTVQERASLLTGDWTPKTGIAISRSATQPPGLPAGYEMAEFSVPISGGSRFYRLSYDATVTDPDKANLNESLDIVATANAASGSVSLVQLLVNGLVVDQLTAGPYNFTRQMTNTGRQEFVIRVTDNLGNVTDTAPQTITVSAGVPPTSFLTTSSSARASAVTNSSGGVASFTNLVGGSGYSTNANQAPMVRLIGGTTNTAASATAQIGASGSLTNVLVTAPGSGYTNVPTVVIDPPPTRINETVILQATATDDQEVRSVGFLINGLIVATVTNAPYTNAFVPSNPGFYQLVARATDNLGNVTDSPALTLRVEAPTNSLTVTIDTPTNNTRFVPGIALTASASVTSTANYPVASVTYYLNGLPVTSTNGTGTVVGPQITSAPYSQQITLANVGDYTLSVLAFDTFGNSAMKDVKISSVAPTNGLAPGITVVHPVPAGGNDTANDFSTPSQLYLNAVVSGDTGTNAPVFFANGVKITNLVTSLSNSTGLTYGVKWFPTANGTYNISAQITGTNSNALTAVSAPLTFFIGDVSRPQPTISLLGLGQTNVGLGSTVTLQAEVGTDLTPIDRVDFYANQVLIGSVIPPVITNGKTTVAFNWQPPSTNDYAISARAQQVLAGFLFDNSVISTGSTTNTNDFILKVQPNESNTPAPIVVLAQQPIADGSYVDGSSLFFNVAVTPDGTNTVSTNANAVSFYFDGARVNGTDTGLAQNKTRTYAVQQNILAGAANRSLFATALDSQNLVGGSAARSLSFTPPLNPLPTVEMLPLLPGAPVDANGNVTLRARAIFPAAASEESRVEFYANGGFIGIGTADVADPTLYTLSWKTPSAAGAFAVKARAVARNFQTNTGNDNSVKFYGSVISDNATDLNTIPGTAPEVTITAPANGANVSVNQDVFVAASAFVPGGNNAVFASITNNSFFFGYITNISTNAVPGRSVTNGQRLMDFCVPLSPTVIVTNQVLSAFDGEIRSVAVTNGSASGPGGLLATVNLATNIATPAGASGTVIGPLPIVGQIITSNQTLLSYSNSGVTSAIKSPASGKITAVSTNLVIGQALPNTNNLVTIVQSGTTGGTIQRVEFFANGNPIGTSTNAPYSANFTPNSSGPYNLSAIAYSQAGLLATAETVTINASLGAPPAVTLTAPAQGVIGQTARLVANPSVSGSGRRIDQVEFLVNNLVVETLTAANEGASYVFNYPVTAPGNYLLQARAKDNVGNVAFSNVLEMPTRTAPSVVLSAPTTGAIGQTITMTAVVTNPDANGDPIPITNVQFFVNGNLIATDPTSPYSANYNILAAGDYQLQAVAIDDEGVTGSSNIVNLNVPAPPPPDPSAPSVSMLVPTTGSSALVGTAVEVLAAASPGQGAEFSSRALTLVAPDGSTSVLPVTITVSGFSSTFTPLLEGPYVVTARVLNSLNKEATATTTVIAQTLPPVPPGSNEAFIIGMYQKILGREPTASEINAGLDDLTDPDFSRADFVYAMVTGPEYGNVQNRVADFFFTLGVTPTRTTFAANVATVRGNTNLMTGFDNYGNSTLWASPSPFGATLGQVASAQSVVNASSFTSLNATNGALVTWMWDRLGGATASWPDVTGRLEGYASAEQQGAVVSFLTANYANLSPFGSVAALASAQQAYQYQLRATAVRFLLGGPWQATGSPGTVQSSLTRLAQLEISTPLGLLSYIEQLLADTAVVLVAPGSASATASATLGGGVTNVIVTTNGTNYSMAPSVTFEAPRFTTAVATPNLGSNGSVTNITMLNSNSNGFYTNVPTVTLGINGGGALATAVAELGAGATAGRVTNIRVTAAGSGFSSGLAWVRVASPAPWQATSSSVDLTNGRVTNISVAYAGTGYNTTNPGVLVGAPQVLPATNNVTNNFSARRFTNAPLVNVSSFQLLVNGKPVATNTNTAAPTFALTPTNGGTNSITNRINVRAMNGSFIIGESPWTEMVVAP